MGNYIGQPIQVVQRAFTSNGLLLDVTYQPTSTSSQAGTVAYQDPGPMALLAKGGTVTVAVYRYAGPSSTVAGVAVPALLGKTQIEAQTALQQDGLVAHFTTASTRDPSEGGKVLSETPSPGTQVPSGSVVTVVMGQHTS